MTLPRRARLHLAPVLLLSLGACREHAPSPVPTPSPPPVEVPDAGPAPDAGSPPQDSDTSSQTFTRMGGGAPRPAWFVCDGTSAPRIGVVERDAQRTHATLTWFDKGVNGPSRPETLTLGAADPGAGQIYYPLSRGAQDAGFVHAVNPGMLADPRLALTPTVGSLKLDSNELSCRWLPGTRVMGFEGHRSVLVTLEGKALVYTTFDFADAAKAHQVPGQGFGTTTAPPSLRLEGGSEERTADGSTFTFRHGAYTYVLHAGRDASLEVRHEGSPVQRTDLLAWTYAPPP